HDGNEVGGREIPVPGDSAHSAVKPSQLSVCALDEVLQHVGRAVEEVVHTQQRMELEPSGVPDAAELRAVEIVQPENEDMLLRQASIAQAVLLWRPGGSRHST